MRIRCPHCHNPIEVVEDSDYKDIDCPSCGSQFNLIGGDSTQEFQPERRKLGQFTLLERVGVGAFGSVYKAHDETLDRTVAIKIPRSEQLEAEDREKFLREARAAAQLKHPNIVAIHEVGREGDSVFIVSDFVEGVTLQSWLTANQPSVTEAAELVEKIAQAVHYAHEQGVIHRDLKPGNIMLDSDGEPHVMDFGLAKREAGEITMTVEGARLGTPAYMPPEQIASAHEADARSDVYSLGVILYELLTGELPFRGDQVMLLHQVQNTEPPSPRKLNSRLPKDMETIVLKCLSKSPSSRYHSSYQLATDIQCFLKGNAIAAKPIGVLQLFWRWYPRHASVMLAAYLIVSGLLVMFGTLGGILQEGWTSNPTLFSAFLGFAFGASIIGYLILRHGFWFEIVSVPYGVYADVVSVSFDLGDIRLASMCRLGCVFGNLLTIGALSCRFLSFRSSQFMQRTR